MSSPRLTVRRAAVLGAGVMGAQIAAHLANADVPVILFDLPAAEGRADALVRKSIAGLSKLQPAPLVTRGRAAAIEAATYANDLARLAECDLVIEAVAERADIKHALYAQVAPHLRDDAVFASNTSGLPLASLAEVLPERLRARFCGVHFFNPPRYMALLELISAPHTDAALLDALESWFTTRLGKSVVRAKDTPNFVANRVGVFALLLTLHHAQAQGLTPDEVDALTGPLIGRPKSATYRTADVIGLDTLAHVVRTMQDTLSDDPWHAHFHLPAWMLGLIERGALGQKSGVGVYRREGKAIRVYDAASGEYREGTGQLDPAVAAILKERDPALRFAALRASAQPQARFLWAMYRDVFHYCAVHLAQIADNARDVDFALRWGFGWAQGPFETWQAAGWRTIAQAIEADIAAGQTLAATPLPAWVLQRDGVHTPQGSYSAASDSLRPRSTLPVYERQIYPETVFGEAEPRQGETLWENAGVRLWHRPDLDAGIGILSFTSKAHAINDAVLDGVQAALDYAERALDGVVIWHEAPFAVGADLRQLAADCEAGAFAKIEAMVANFQRTALRLKYAQVPVVAALQGMALGGGCEFALQSSERVFALESPIGLVEAGVGLIPAGGGCKEMALQAAALAARTANRDPLACLQPLFMPIATARLAANAIEARDRGFAQAGDSVVFHPREVLYVALQRARALSASGYHPPLPARAVAVAGRDGIATLQMTLVNMREGGQISAHDYRVGSALAEALCGGAVDSGMTVDEDWLLAVERRLFIELLQTPETQARIRHMLDTGKPLRN
ncbi:3-hydroxyacyl-CoA dehydrogenase/enoyl-CoA hydratase family protein [Plasticicumulans acidivorans]|uniref:3-hydroxyacyl-CoA dehydrogenase n=1 Tax=Plasticicumulans acidivorans TaxID=886464 RepID=A0A317MW95_9GAMM|nr:3-hydroxyacyl-CoA dehydrogenase/enoyl-CoA hydratase family protein [Plasticicumulans acidivorans]PWV62230.1 3-hydroxyacyl-CoA dehydrogenase [Plasticicumulans acidivorans]